MKRIEWNGKKLKIMREIDDPKYGRVWLAYLDYIKTYIVEGKIVEEQSVIDELDDKYDIPVDEREIVF